MSEPRINIQDVNISHLNESNHARDVAIAKAVQEGMRALALITNSNTYGIYIAPQNEEENSNSN